MDTPVGSMPTFVIAGVQKCGTTSLFQALALHPRVIRPRQKELHFFDQKWGKGIDWYAAQFPDLAPDQLTGESTPVYSYDKTARRRMAQTLPDARLIVVLRDPVARAYSHYWHSRRHREDLPTFEEAIAAEPGRLKGKGRALARRRFSYLDRGHYVRDLKPLGRAYGDQLLVTTLERLSTDTTAELARVMRHVGVDPDDLPELVMPEVNRHRTLSRREERELAGARPSLWDRIRRRPPVIRDRERPTLAPETRERLREHFAESDAQLLQWLGWDRLPWDSLANPTQPISLREVDLAGRNAAV